MTKSLSILVLATSLFLFDSNRCADELSDNINQATCDRIRPGMTEPEVNSILGRERQRMICINSCMYHYWIGERGCICVAQMIRNPGVVYSATFSPEPTSREIGVRQPTKREEPGARMSLPSLLGLILPRLPRLPSRITDKLEIGAEEKVIVNTF